MFEQHRFTTAHALGDFRKELIEGGFSSDEAFSLSMVAAKMIVDADGLCVRDAEGADA